MKAPARAVTATSITTNSGKLLSGPTVTSHTCGVGAKGDNAPPGLGPSVCSWADPSATALKSNVTASVLGGPPHGVWSATRTPLLELETSGKAKRGHASFGRVTLISEPLLTVSWLSGCLGSAVTSFAVAQAS